MLRKKHASSVKLQNSINKLLIRMRKSSSLPVRNSEENQTASTKEQPTKEMIEDPIIIDRKM